MLKIDDGSIKAMVTKLLEASIEEKFQKSDSIEAFMDDFMKIFIDGVKAKRNYYGPLVKTCRNVILAGKANIPAENKWYDDDLQGLMKTGVEKRGCLALEDSIFAIATEDLKSGMSLQEAITELGYCLFNYFSVLQQVHDAKQKGVV